MNSYHSIPTIIIHSKYYLGVLCAYECNVYDTRVIFLYAKVLTHASIVDFGAYVLTCRINTKLKLFSGWLWSTWNPPNSRVVIVDVEIH